MCRFANGTAISLLLVLAPGALAQQGGMQGMSCCMMGGHPMGMGLMVTLSVLIALFLLSASAALIALAIFLLRRSRITPQA